MRNAELIQNGFNSEIHNPCLREAPPAEASCGGQALRRRQANSAIGSMDTQSRYLRLRRKDIAYFKFIIESYEGVALVRTKDPHEAVVELMVAPGWERDIDEILEGLREEIPIEDLSKSQFQNPNVK